MLTKPYPTCHICMFLSYLQGSLFQCLSTLSEEKIFLISNLTFAFTSRHRQSVMTGPPWESPQGSGHEDADTLNCLIGDSSLQCAMNFPSRFSTWSFWVGWRRRWCCRAGVSRVLHSRGAFRDNHRCGMGYAGLGAKPGWRRELLFPVDILMHAGVEAGVRGWARVQLKAEQWWGESQEVHPAWEKFLSAVAVPLMDQPADRDGGLCSPLLSSYIPAPWQMCGPASNLAVGSGAVRGVLC